MMIVNGGGLGQHIKRWYQALDLLMQSLKEVRICILPLKERKVPFRAILMVKQIW
nr:MAG TPA: hypothetical protein [Caudoviricetes sp.]